MPLKAEESRLRGQLEPTRARSQLGPLRRLDHRARRRHDRRAHQSRRPRRRPLRPRQSRGQYLLYYTDGQFWTIDTARRTVDQYHQGRSRPRSSTASRIRPTCSGRGSASPAGRRATPTCCSTTSSTSGRLRPTGAKATRLTDGAAEQIEYRYADLDPRCRRDRSRRSRSTSSMCGTLDQEVRLRAAGARRAPRPRQLVWLDKSVTRLAKAKDADVYALRRAELRRLARRVRRRRRSRRARSRSRRPTRSRAKYAWGRAELVEFKSEKGQRLQGVLRYPAGYEPGKKYPMIVYVYEKLSDCAAQLHRAVGARLLQRHVVHQRRLLRVRARHRLPSARAGAVGRRVRAARGRRGRRRWASSIRRRSA